MVYCQKCGAQNEDDTALCASCGEPLRAPSRRGRGWEEEIEVRAEEFGARAERWGRSMEDECFGIPRGGNIVGILFGLFIIVWGASELMGWSIDLGPFAIIAFGLLIVIGVLSGQRRGRR